MSRLLLILSVFALSLVAKEYKDPSLIFAKKCQMCHALRGPQNDMEKRLTAAPNMPLAMKSVSVGIDAIEEPKDKATLRKLVIAHIEEYIFNPGQDKSYCEQIIFDKFKTMPTLKGFISQNEAKLVAPWIYDNFAPAKYKVTAP